MELGTLRDGGLFIVSDKQINKWDQIYKNVNVKSIIKELEKNKSFTKLTKKAALKLINKTLKEREALI